MNTFCIWSPLAGHILLSGSFWCLLPDLELLSVAPLFQPPFRLLDNHLLVVTVSIIFIILLIFYIIIQSKCVFEDSVQNDWAKLRVTVKIREISLQCLLRIHWKVKQLQQGWHTKPGLHGLLEHPFPSGQKTLDLQVVGHSSLMMSVIQWTSAS